jgi:hypothetical protein
MRKKKYYIINKYTKLKIMSGFHNTSRWITKDPIDFEGGINLYGYVVNDPVTFVDPWGLEISLCKTGNGGIGYHKFWKTSDNQSIGFYPLSGNPERWYQPGIRLSPDPHQDDEDLSCESYPANDCVKKCILDTKNDESPRYFVIGYNCRVDSQVIYHRCKTLCSK